MPDLEPVPCIGRDRNGKKCGKSYKGLCNSRADSSCRRGIEECLIKIYGQQVKALFICSALGNSCSKRIVVQESLNHNHVQEGTRKWESFLRAVQLRKSLASPNKVEAVKREARTLEPMLKRFYESIPNVLCPFEGKIYCLIGVLQFDARQAGHR